MGLSSPLSIFPLLLSSGSLCGGESLWDDWSNKLTFTFGKLRWLVLGRTTSQNPKTLPRIQNASQNPKARPRPGNFQLARIFFSLIACAGIFFLGEPLCTNFFFRQILLFFEQWNIDSLSMFLCFVNYSTLTTDQRIQATLMQNLFENVHSVREEEATWSGRLPCAFF